MDSCIGGRVQINRSASRLLMLRSAILGLAMLVIEPTLVAADPALEAYPFFRAVRCGAISRTAGRRYVRKCEAEEQSTVTLGPDGPTIAAKTTVVPPRLSSYPAEIAMQWRYCPWKPNALLDRQYPSLTPYEDPLVGGCYVWRPLPRDAKAIPIRARLDRLDQLHPWLADTFRYLTAMAAAEGIEVHIVSAVRGGPYALVGNKHVKRGGRRRASTVVTGQMEAGMHPWGLAVDINIGWRQPLRDPVGAYRRGGAARAAFDRVGKLAEDLGVFWLGRNKVSEIQHFEFHPGWSGSVRGEVLSTLSQQKRAGGVESTWTLLHYDSSRKTPFAALRDSPIDLPNAPSATEPTR